MYYHNNQENLNCFNLTDCYTYNCCNHLNDQTIFFILAEITWMYFNFKFHFISFFPCRASINAAWWKHVWKSKHHFKFQKAGQAWGNQKKNDRFTWNFLISQEEMTLIWIRIQTKWRPIRMNLCCISKSGGYPIQIPTKSLIKSGFLIEMIRNDTKLYRKSNFCIRFVCVFVWFRIVFRIWVFNLYGFIEIRINLYCQCVCFVAFLIVYYYYSYLSLYVA